MAARKKAGQHMSDTESTDEPTEETPDEFVVTDEEVQEAIASEESEGMVEDVEGLPEGWLVTRVDTDHDGPNYYVEHSNTSSGFIIQQKELINEAIEAFMSDNADKFEG